MPLEPARWHQQSRKKERVSWRSRPISSSCVWRRLVYLFELLIGKERVTATVLPWTSLPIPPLVRQPRAITLSIEDRGCRQRLETEEKWVLNSGWFLGLPFLGLLFIKFIGPGKTPLLRRSRQVQSLISKKRMLLSWGLDLESQARLL